MSERFEILITARDAASTEIRQVGQELTGLGKTGDVAGRSLSRALGSIDTGKLKDFGGKMTLGVTLPFLAMSGAAMKAAGDVGESLNKVNVVFGSSASIIAKWSDTTASSLGQSKGQALEAAGSFGSLFRAIGITESKSAEMSMSMVKLASDLASFHNADPSDVIAAIGSAMRGESEPISRFGVLMNEATLKAQALKMGLISNTKDALQPAIKAQAAYGLILEQTKLAQGDFANTADSAANSQRRFKAELEDVAAKTGAIVLPVGQKLLGFAGQALGAFNALPDPVKNTGLAIGGIAAAAGPAAFGLGVMIDTGKKLGEGWDMLTKAGRFVIAMLTGQKIESGVATVAAGVHKTAMDVDTASVVVNTKAVEANTVALNVNAGAAGRAAGARAGAGAAGIGGRLAGVGAVAVGGAAALATIGTAAVGAALWMDKTSRDAMDADLEANREGLETERQRQRNPRAFKIAQMERQIRAGEAAGKDMRGLKSLRDRFVAEERAAAEKEGRGAFGKPASGTPGAASQMVGPPAPVGSRSSTGDGDLSQMYRALRIGPYAGSAPGKTIVPVAPAPRFVPTVTSENVGGFPSHLLPGRGGAGVTVNVHPEVGNAGLFKDPQFQVALQEFIARYESGQERKANPGVTRVRG